MGVKSGRPLPELAFGGGARACPGRLLAQALARALLRTVLAEAGPLWTLEPGQDLTKRYTPGLFPVGGLLVRAVPMRV